MATKRRTKDDPLYSMADQLLDNMEANGKSTFNSFVTAEPVNLNKKAYAGKFARERETKRRREYNKELKEKMENRT